MYQCVKCLTLSLCPSRMVRTVCEVFNPVSLSIQDREDSGELKIMNVQLRHEGRYTCTAQTVVDNVTASADLKVKGLPAPPGGVRVEEIRDTSVKLVWNRGADHGSLILGYTIQTRDFYALTEVDWRDASTCKYRSIPPEGVITLPLTATT